MECIIKKILNENQSKQCFILIKNNNNNKNTEAVMQVPYPSGVLGSLPWSEEESPRYDLTQHSLLYVYDIFHVFTPGTQGEISNSVTPCQLMHAGHLATEGSDSLH